MSADKDKLDWACFMSTDCKFLSQILIERGAFPIQFSEMSFDLHPFRPTFGS